MQQPYRQPAEEKHISALGITAFVLGVIALVLSWIPIVNNVAFAFAIAGIIFGCFALYATRKNGKKKGRGLVIAAVIISSSAAEWSSTRNPYTVPPWTA